MNAQRGAVALFLAAYLSFLIFELPEYGLTWDMNAEYPRAAAYIDRLIEGVRDPSELAPDERTPWHELSYEQAKGAHHSSANGCLPSLLAAASGKLFFQKLHWLGAIDAYHLGLVLLWIACLAYLYRRLEQLHGSTIALLSVLFLALAPRVLAAVPNNMKDLPSAAFLAIALVEALRAMSTARSGAVLSAAFFFGCALASKFTVVLGVVPLIGIAIVGGFRRRAGLRYGRRFLISLAAAPLIMASVFIAHWPHLWISPPDAWARLQRVLAIGSSRKIADPQWTIYPLEMIALSTPLVVLIFATCGTLYAVKCLIARESTREVWLYLIWFWTIVGFWSSGRIFIFDGIRNFIQFWPALAILAAHGVACLLRWSETLSARAHRLTQAGLGACIGGGLIVPLILYHPHEITYFNALAGGLEGAIAHERNTAREIFEARDYWGSSLRRVQRGANEHLPEGALVVFGIPSHVGRYYPWRSDLITAPAPPPTSSTEQYALVLNRPAYFDECERNLAQYGVLVHAEQIRGVTLSALYRITGDCTPCHTHQVRPFVVRPTLAVSSSELSASAVEGLSIRIGAGALLANHEYVLKLSMRLNSSDETPEFLRCPLESDELTERALVAANGPGFEGFAGRVDEHGNATARLGPFPTGVLAPWLGQTIHVSVAVRDCRGTVHSSPHALRVVK